MIQSNYTIKEIEKFLEIDADVKEEEHSMSLRKLIQVKDKISIFKNIDEYDLKAIVYDVEFIKYKFKDYIVKENDDSNNILFIIKGECQVFHNKKIVAKLKSGEIFGETAAIFHTKRNASVVCSSEETTLLSFCIDQKNLEFCAEALALLYKNLAFEINAKLEDLNDSFISRKRIT